MLLEIVLTGVFYYQKQLIGLGVKMVPALDKKCTAERRGGLLALKTSYIILNGSFIMNLTPGLLFTSSAFFVIRKGTNV